MVFFISVTKKPFLYSWSWLAGPASNLFVLSDWFTSIVDFLKVFDFYRIDGWMLEVLPFKNSDRSASSLSII